MSRSTRTLLPLFALVGFALHAASAQAAMIISEVDATGNSQSYGDDWFEITNTGPSAVDIAGWKVDDGSNSLSSAATIAGVGSIAAGQSVIVFTEVTAGELATKVTQFVSAWFNGSAPSGLVFGYADGGGLGLGNGGDALNLWNASNVLQTSVTFGAASSTATFDNATGAAALTSANYSVVGVNGAFASLSASNAEIGSPGSISAVPLPAAAWLLLSGIGVVGSSVRRRQRAAA